MKKIVFIFALVLTCFTSTIAGNSSPKTFDSCTRSFSGNGITVTVTNYEGDCNAAFLTAYYIWKGYQV
ncbi:hypothetical protein [Emticicia sp.]|jgi:hypothetical protein|uniref:hypothetical protein n=1 Tax=Emticicia sp. TaxID=1930953 RepID=UPI0037516327